MIINEFIAYLNRKRLIEMHGVHMLNLTNYTVYFGIKRLSAMKNTRHKLNKYLASLKHE